MRIYKDFHIKHSVFTEPDAHMHILLTERERERREIPKRWYTGREREREREIKFMLKKARRM